MDVMRHAMALNGSFLNTERMIDQHRRKWPTSAEHRCAGAAALVVMMVMMVMMAVVGSRCSGRTA